MLFINKQFLLNSLTVQFPCNIKMQNEFYELNHLSADLTQRSLDMTSFKKEHASSD